MTTHSYKVIITTSGTGSRLGELTKYTNKALIRVGNKPPLSYILESYPTDTSFVITLGYKGDYVKQFIELCYPYLEVEYVEIDNYDQDGSCLLYSLSCAEKKLQCPFVIHCCDAITNQSPEPFGNNWLGTGTAENTDEYCTIGIKDSSITHLNLKDDVKLDFIHIGIMGIWDYEVFWQISKKLLLNRQKSTYLDVDIINQMLEDDHKFEPRYYSDWLDIGNISALNATKTKVPSDLVVLDKSNQSVFMLNDKIIKFFDDHSGVTTRVKRATDLYPVLPKIVSSTANFYAYQKIEGHLMSESIDIPNISHFLNWCQENLWKPSGVDIHDCCQKFYYEKTIKRLKEFYRTTNIVDTEEIINKIAMPRLTDIMSKIDWCNIFNGISTHSFHGDLHFNNIFCTGDTYALIDWRDDFGGNSDQGDVYYDLSKFYSGMIISHDIILNNQFSVRYTKNEIDFNILISYKSLECQKILKQFILDNQYDWNKVQVLTALILLNMCPLHHYPFNILLYYFGKYMLYQTLGG